MHITPSQSRMESTAALPKQRLLLSYRSLQDSPLKPLVKYSLGCTLLAIVLDTEPKEGLPVR